MKLYDGKLWLYGDVGETDGDHFTAIEVRAALAKHGPKDLTVHVNSPGGYTDDGIAIHSLLKSHPGKVTVIVDAAAFSAASLIAMAGDQILMRTGSLMMIHDPSIGVFGTAREVGQTVKHLEALAQTIVRIYSERTKRSSAEIRAMMVEETWLTPENAVAKGFADGILAGSAMPMNATAHAAVMANAPAALRAVAQVQLSSRERLQAMVARQRTVKSSTATAQDPVKASHTAALAAAVASLNKRKC